MAIEQVDAYLEARRGDFEEQLKAWKERLGEPRP